MVHLKNLFASLEWWKLRPAQDLLAEQPGGSDASRFIVASRSEDRTWSLIYSPVGGTISVKGIDASAAARWFNPRLGEWSAAQPGNGTERVFRTPDSDDWVLWLGPAK